MTEETNGKVSTKELYKAVLSIHEKIDHIKEESDRKYVGKEMCEKQHIDFRKVEAKVDLVESAVAFLKERYWIGVGAIIVLAPIFTALMNNGVKYITGNVK